LIRATDGKSKDERKDRIQLSTVVQADELEGFFVKYADVCKVGMGGLKKRDRSRRKAKAKKKKGPGAGAVEGDKTG
jgi:signal recognition particle subunit SRP14